MTERQFKAKLIKEIRSRLRTAVIFSHNDMVTAGIPDISISMNGYTLWIEAKLESNKKTNRLQDETLNRLTGIKVTMEKIGYRVDGRRNGELVSWHFATLDLLANALCVRIHLFADHIKNYD